MRFFLYFFLLTSLFLSGCVLRQEVHFNENLGGRYSFEFDFSKFKEFNDKDKEMEYDQENLDSTLMQRTSDLNNVIGVSNIEVSNSLSEGILNLSYNFADISSLNKSLVFSSSLDLKGEKAELPASFTIKGKKLIYTRPGREVEPDSTAEIMSELFRYDFVITFEKEVKKVKIKSGSVYISDDKRKLYEKGNMFDIARNEAKWIIKFK